LTIANVVKVPASKNAIFFSHPFVKKVLFNDTRANPRVMMWPHHDNHFHVELK
jgi:murein endopeptidase